MLLGCQRLRPMKDTHVARKDFSEPPGQCAGGSHHGFSWLAKCVAWLEVRARGDVGPAIVPPQAHPCGDRPCLAEPLCALDSERGKPRVDQECRQTQGTGLSSNPPGGESQDHSDRKEMSLMLCSLK